jgi:hypothetical protein
MSTSFLTRTFKRWIARVMACVLLLAQFSIAAYACPAMAMQDDTGTAEQLVAGTAVPVGAADPLDASAPNLCAAHCQFGQQSADHTAATVVQTALPATLYTLPSATAHDGLGRPLAHQPPSQAAASPPLAILHCCFRI